MRRGRVILEELAFSVNGVKVQVSMTSTGVFKAPGPGGEMHFNKSLEGLKRTVRDAYRKDVKIRVPAMLYTEGKPADPYWNEEPTGDQFTTIAITGRHPRTRQVSVFNIDTKETSMIYSTHGVIRVLTGAECEELARLRVERDAAATAFTTFLESVSIDVDGELRAAMEALK